jgi:malate dehydrogenase (quinone)
MPSRHYDLIIIGGGVTGTALLNTVARYTDISRIALLEKYDQPARVNSYGRNNSQTLHCGDIETNYTLEKAQKVKRAARMIVNYVEQLPEAERGNILYRMPKMALGIGEEEIETVAQRAEEFSSSFPYMSMMNKEKIAEIEPRVALLDGKPRAEPIAAFGCENEYSATDFAALSRSFIEHLPKQPGRQVEVHFNTRVTAIEQAGEHFRITSGGDTWEASAVVVAACGHSLLLAQQMGYGLEFSCLPVAGSFYLAPKLINGKVYTLQNKKLPFAAIHADSDFLVDGRTRFGPTALLLPLLERYNLSSLPEFLRVLQLDSRVFAVFRDLLKDRDIRNYIFRNFLYEVPLLRKRLFLKEAQKIVPSLKLNDLSYARHFGGVRPQLIDKQQRKLLLGEAKINPGNGIIFNMTPSPGASSCLGNAETDMRSVVDYLGASINEDALHSELHRDD